MGLTDLISSDMTPQPLNCICMAAQCYEGILHYQSKLSIDQRGAVKWLV